MLELLEHHACWRGVRVELTVGEFKVLSDLVAHPSIDRTYRQLYDAVRGEGFVAGHDSENPAAGFRVNVRNFIRHIRKKFRDIDPGFDRIKLYHGFGYRWSDDTDRYVLREVG